MFLDSSLLNLFFNLKFNSLMLVSRLFVMKNKILHVYWDKDLFIEVLNQLRHNNIKYFHEVIFPPDRQLGIFTKGSST